MCSFSMATLLSDDSWIFADPELNRDFQLLEAAQVPTVLSENRDLLPPNTHKFYLLNTLQGALVNGSGIEFALLFFERHNLMFIYSLINFLETQTVSMF